MARPKTTPGGRPVTVHVRLSERETAGLDEVRGRLTRSAFLRYGLSLAASEYRRNRTAPQFEGGVLRQTSVD